MSVALAYCTLLWLIASTCVALRSASDTLAALRRRELCALAGLVALAWWIRAGLAPPSILRGHYNGYVHLRTVLETLEGRGHPTEAFKLGHGVLLALVDGLRPVDLTRWLAVDITVGVLAVPASFLALWRWTDDVTDALVGSLVVALDPVHARFSASEDPMPLTALCAWLALLGLALFQRDRRPAGAWLAAGAIAFAISVKADCVMLVLGFGALGWARRPEASTPLPRTTLAMLAVGLAVVIGDLALGSLRSQTFMSNPRYGGMSLLAYGQHLLEYPFSLVLHNPLADPRYAAPAVTLLAFFGIVAGCARVDRVTLAALGFLAVLFVRIYEDFPLPFDEMLRETEFREDFRKLYPARLLAGVKGDARWNLHAMVPWTLLVVDGARWLRGRVRSRYALLALALAAVASFATTRAWWRHRWTDQREAELLVRAAARLPLPCAIVIPRDVPAQGVVARHDLPLALLDVADRRWRLVPRIREDAEIVDPALRRCAVYYRGLSCYVWDSNEERDRHEHPHCAALFASPGLAPVPGLVERVAYEDYSAFFVSAPMVTLGFYRARTP